VRFQSTSIAMFLVTGMAGCGGMDADPADDVTAQALISCTPGQAVCAPTPPVRPTYQDVTIRTPPGSFYQWFRGRIATQTLRDAMEETLTGVALPEAIRYARTMTSCAAIAKSTVGELTKITMRLGPVYEQQQSLEANGVWSIPVFGRHYQIEQHQLAKIRACSLGSAATACAANPLMTRTGTVPNALADLLDIRIDNGRCVEGALFSLSPPVEPFDANRANVGIVQSKTPMTPPATSVLHATHTAHQQTSNFQCGTGPAPTASVRDAHMALEATAITEDQHHFFRLKDFSGIPDPDWSPQQVCQWARLQDAAHERWMNAVSQGDWAHARQADDDHQLAHICMNLKHPDLKVRFSCGPSLHVEDCPVLTCQQVLATLPPPS
jgi:hypothetical protein